MSSGDSVPGHYCYFSGDVDPRIGEAATADNFLEMFGDYTGDLFEFVREGGPEETAAMEVHRSSASSLSPVPVLEPPSKDEMAAWLYPIVRGTEDQIVTDQPTGGRTAEEEEANKLPAELPRTEDVRCSKGTSSDSSEKKTTTRPKRRPLYSQIHSLTEKRRRCKVNQRLKTLRQLVPGCDKSNQASTLDQTIQYIKSLQQLLQAMSVGCSIPMVATSSVRAAAAPPPMPSLGAASIGMIPVDQFTGTLPPMLPLLVQHPAVVVPAATAPDITPAVCSKNNTQKNISKSV